MHDGNLVLPVVVGLLYVLANLPVYIFVLDFPVFCCLWER